MYKVLNVLKAFWLKITYPLRKSYKANICKHQTKLKGRITSKGESFTMLMPLSTDGKPDYCLECITRMSIDCAWCKEPIHIGDPVTLYAPKKGFAVPEHGVRYLADSKYFVGCLRFECALSGADRQGFWMPPGEVSRVPSPMEMAMNMGSSGKAVIVQDLSDPTNIGKIVR